VIFHIIIERNRNIHIPSTTLDLKQNIYSTVHSYIALYTSLLSTQTTSNGVIRNKKYDKTKIEAKTPLLLLTPSYQIGEKNL
jgi:hypothetical protein